MFKLTDAQINEFAAIYKQAQAARAFIDMYYNNIKMLHYIKPFYLTQEMYDDLYDGLLADIELVSSPIDIVIPNNTEYPKDENGKPIIPEDYTICVLNDCVPEYERIKKRVTIDDIKKTVEPSSPLYMAVLENPDNILKIINDVFRFWCIRRFFVRIEMGHLEELSILTPIIEYVVENVTMADLKNHLRSKKIKSMDKMADYIKETIFLPDLGRTKAFYNTENPICEIFDAENLLHRLVSNITIKPDMYIITGIYHAMSFAMNDIARNIEIYNDQIEHGIEVPDISLSKCEEYVIDVLSKL